MDSYNRGGRRPPLKLSSEARAGGPSPSSPLSPRAGWCRVNQSCLTADMWFHSVIRYLPGQKGQSTATGTGAPSGATLEWRRVAPEDGSGARVAPVYTRHIRNTKGQRSL